MAVAAYISACDTQDPAAGCRGGAGGSGVGGRQLTGEERRALWGCCRFTYCSTEVKAALVQLPEAMGGLMEEFLLGVVAREGRETGAVVEGLKGLEGGRSSQTRARAKLVRVVRSGSLPLFSSSNLFSTIDGWGREMHHTHTPASTARHAPRTHTTYARTKALVARERERGILQREKELELQREKELELAHVSFYCPPRAYHNVFTGSL
jgi:hypothetical protein